MTIYNALRGRTRYAGLVNTKITSSAIVTLTGIAVAVSSWPGYPASNVLDGNDNTLWACGSSPVDDKWIYIDFYSTKNVAGYKIKQYQANGYSATRFKVQKSNDATSWVDVDDVSTSNLLTTKTFYEIQPARYVRFYAITGGSEQWQISTIELYGYSQ